MPDLTASVVCLLNDDPSALKDPGRLLTSAGWPAEPFRDPEKFFLYARTHRTPVAIIDVWMGLMNGPEVQSRLGEISLSIRVTIFSGKNQPLIRFTALAGGAIGVIRQALRRRTILTAIRFAFGRT